MAQHFQHSTKLTPKDLQCSKFLPQNSRCNLSHSCVPRLKMKSTAQMLSHHNHSLLSFTKERRKSHYNYFHEKQKHTVSKSLILLIWPFGGQTLLYTMYNQSKLMLTLCGWDTRHTPYLFYTNPHTIIPSSESQAPNLPYTHAQIPHPKRGKWPI